MKKTIGYTTGVFDLFHIGHLNILIKAKRNCDHLIVGVLTDELAIKIKGKKPVIPFSERKRILECIKFVDEVVPQNRIDEIADYHDLNFSVIFKGDDWKNTEKWKKLEHKFKELGVKVIFFPYTKHISSTQIRKCLESS
jgi:glycerol-3-phosphate cytidylyltransferase